MHLGVYLDCSSNSNSAGDPGVASNVTAFTIYTFLSNACLVRPLGEAARLHITQVLADLEMALEQFVSMVGGTSTLNHVELKKPYAELRAVRQMLFWTGLDNRGKPADDVAKSLLREVWTKDMRASTIFHYLFSIGPSTLSSPHHVKRMTAGDYVGTLIQLDGSVVTGEDAAWLTVMACCDSYVQRASAGGTAAAAADRGDARWRRLSRRLVKSSSDAADATIRKWLEFVGGKILRRITCSLRFVAHGRGSNL